jgi:hypothetical protein
MNYSRNFLVIGALYLIIGIGFGIYMGGSQDFTLAPVHAHINLIGFVLMTLFGLAYRLIPALAGNSLAKAHFWLHQVGAAGTLLFLFLLISGIAPAVAPMMPIFEGLIALGIIAWAINLYQNA